MIMLAILLLQGCAAIYVEQRILELVSKEFAYFLSVQSSIKKLLLNKTILPATEKIVDGKQVNFIYVESFPPVMKP
jgi:hypothetical protein